MVETGYWNTIKGEAPLPDDVTCQVVVTIKRDGTIQCQTRSPEGRRLDDVVRDVETARDRLTEQLEQRHARCPMFAAVNAA